MRSLCVLIVLLAALGIVSCGENAPPASSGGRLAAPGSQLAPQPSPGVAASAGNDTPAPPPGAQTTIYCGVLQDTNHVERSRQLKEQLIKVTGMPEWYVIHSETESTLYYGYYRDIDDPKNPREGQRAKADRQKVAALRAGDGSALFPGCTIVALEAPDPNDNPEWEITRAPRDRYWTLEIAAYAYSPDRKKAAIDSVKAARAQGLEAYYYHGDFASSVFIGSWPIDAVKRQEVQKEAADGEEHSVLVSPVPVPEKVARHMRDANGHALTVLTPRIEVQDPTLLEKMREFPTHAVNGMVTVYKDSQGRDAPERSSVVEIPGREYLLQGLAGPEAVDAGGLQERAVEATGVHRDARTPDDDAIAPDPGAGRLRSLGGR